MKETFEQLKMPEEGVPTWDGDPGSFESFCTNCQWYSHGLKDSERKLAASRVWQKLNGAAKSVVKHLDPKEFNMENGLEKLLTILRESPLQKLPVPASFNRLEKWSGLRRGQGESIPQLLVREEELFTDLQQALKRVRMERKKVEMRTTASGARERDPSESPTRSPTMGAGLDDMDDALGDGQPQQGDSSMESGFFENELRGYRLLKSSKLSTSEKQHVLTLTKNSTHFVLVRQALRSLFAETDIADEMKQQKRAVWFTEAPAEWDDWETYGDEWDDPQWWDAEAYRAEWQAEPWEDAEEAYYGEYYEYQPLDDTTKTAEELSEEKRFEEALALATEANKTLSEAKKAIARVRQARGYHDSTGMILQKEKGK